MLKFRIENQGTTIRYFEQETATFFALTTVLFFPPTLPFSFFTSAAFPLTALDFVCFLTMAVDRAGGVTVEVDFDLGDFFLRAFLATTRDLDPVGLSVILTSFMLATTAVVYITIENWNQGLLICFRTKFDLQQYPAQSLTLRDRNEWGTTYEINNRRSLLPKLAIRKLLDSTAEGENVVSRLIDVAGERMVVSRRSIAFSGVRQVRIRAR